MFTRSHVEDTEIHHLTSLDIDIILLTVLCLGFFY